MAEGTLRCNLQTCRKLLEDNALVTSCSHVFCQKHGQICMKNGNCIACATPFRNKYDFNQLDLQPSDQCKAMILSGLHPDQVLEIANRSISFFIYQLCNENRLKEELLKQAKEEKDTLKSFCASMKTNLNTEIENMKRVANGLKQELNEKMAELEKQREHLAQYSRINKKLQLELAACKRHILTLKTQESPRMKPQNPQDSPPFGFNTGAPPQQNIGSPEFTFAGAQSPSTNFSPRWRMGF